MLTIAIEPRTREMRKKTKKKFIGGSRNGVSGMARTSNVGGGGGERRKKKQRAQQSEGHTPVYSPRELESDLEKKEE